MTRFTKEDWRALIAEQAASGQTAMAFCAERGIDNKYFSTKRKQLNTGVSESRFVSVMSKPGNGCGIQLLVGAVQLRVPLDTPAPWLADLIKAIR